MKETPTSFLYQIEFCPNPNCIKIHARSRFPEGDVMDQLDLSILNEKENWKKHGVKERHPLYSELGKIEGLVSASAHRLSLQVIKAEMFNWDELLPKILAAVQTTVAENREMVPLADPKRPTQERLDALRSQGCDV